MVDFYSHGSIVGFSLTSYPALFIFLYIIFVSSLYLQTKVLPIHRLMLFISSYKSVKNILPSHWRITQMSFLTISKIENGFKVFIKVRSKIDKNIWTCDWIEVDNRGRIIKSDLQRVISRYDEDYKSEIIEFNRDKKIKNLGL